MAFLTASLVFVLYSSGFFLLMRRNMFEVLLGVLMASHATNLLLLAMGGWSADSLPPLIMPGREAEAGAYADPLVQALILTAIVIGFGVASYLMVLMARALEETGNPEASEMGLEEGEA